MAKEIMIFQRIEKKYLLSPEQHHMLLSEIGHRLEPDKHGRSTICSLYLDTPDYRLIRASIDAKAYKDSVYKEKLRLRSYGTPTDDSKVFLEIKKKFKGVVYKRRVSMKLGEAMRYISGGNAPIDSQIMREIDYAMHFYNHPTPKALLCYERDAYYVREDSKYRITFDSNVRYRDFDLNPTLGSEGKIIQPANTILMEIKTDGAMPLWLSAALTRCGIYPATFSKYGTAYEDIFRQKKQVHTKGALIHA